MTLTTINPQAREIAKTIARQIGSDTLFAVSARDYKFWTNPDVSVTYVFRFGSRYGLAKWVEITYQQASDDYDLTAYKIRRNGKRETFRFEGESVKYHGLYAESLAPLVRSINQQAEFA